MAERYQISTPSRGYVYCKKAGNLQRPKDHEEERAFDKVIMANNDQVDKWKKFASCKKEKRLKKPGPNIGGKRNKDAKAEPAGLSYVINKKEITVQPLATEASGKAQKYDRTGAQEFGQVENAETAEIAEIIIFAQNEIKRD